MEGGRERETATHHSFKHHLVSLPVLDLVVKVLRQLQAPVNVLLKPYCALWDQQTVAEF